VLLTVGSQEMFRRAGEKPKSIQVEATTEDGWIFWALTVDPDSTPQARAAFQEHLSEWPGTWQKRVRSLVANELDYRRLCSGKWVDEHSQLRVEFEKSSVKIS